MITTRFRSAIGLFVLIFLSSTLSAQTYSNYVSSDGKKFAVSVRPEKSEIMFGETTYLVFEVKNLSDTKLTFGDGGDYRNNMGRPERYSVKVVREDGTNVPQPEVTFSTGGLIGVQHVPLNGSYKRKLFLPDWATFQTPGTYNISVTRTLSINGSDEAPAFGSKSPTINPVKTIARTKITIVKTDDRELGSVIRTLGDAMLVGSKEEGTRDKLVLLNFIKDPRVIPYWIKAVDIYSRSTDYRTLENFRQTPGILAEYETDEAMDVLEVAMKSKNDDVRYDIADALIDSKHPRALPLLFSMEDDSNYLVRLRVLQAWGKITSDESTQKLIRGLTDKHDSLRSQAEQLLRARKKLPDVMPLLPLANLKCEVRQISAVTSLQGSEARLSTTSGGGGNFNGHKCDEALKAFLDELSSKQAEKDTLGEAWVLYQIGDIYLETKRYKDARTYYEMALPIFRSLKNDAEASILNELAGVNESLKDYPKALDYLNQELTLVKSSEDKRIRSDEWRIMDRIAKVYFELGDEKNGFGFLLKRLHFVTQEENKHGQITAHRALGEAYEERGRKAEALEAYRKALDGALILVKDWYGSFMKDYVKQLKEAIDRLKK